MVFLPFPSVSGGDSAGSSNGCFDRSCVRAGDTMRAARCGRRRPPRLGLAAVPVSALSPPCGRVAFWFGRRPADGATRPEREEDGDGGAAGLFLFSSRPIRSIFLLGVSFLLAGSVCLSSSINSEPAAATSDGAASRVASFLRRSAPGPGPTMPRPDTSVTGPGRERTEVAPRSSPGSRDTRRARITVATPGLATFHATVSAVCLWR